MIDGITDVIASGEYRQCRICLAGMPLGKPLDGWTVTVSFEGNKLIFTPHVSTCEKSKRQPCDTPGMQDRHYR